MDEGIFTPTLIGNEAGGLPALVRRNVSSVDDAVLPAAPVHLLAWKSRTIRTAVEEPLQPFGLFHGQIGQQSAVRVDGQAVNVGGVHTRGVFSDETTIGDNVRVVETCQQVL